jgi:hypothetical protein
VPAPATPANVPWASTSGGGGFFADAELPAALKLMQLRQPQASSATMATPTACLYQNLSPSPSPRQAQPSRVARVAAA